MRQDLTLEIKYIGLSAAMIAKTLSVNELVDMEWKFGATAATSEVQDAGTCFLQVLRLHSSLVDFARRVLLEVLRSD